MDGIRHWCECRRRHWSRISSSEIDLKPFIKDYFFYNRGVASRYGTAHTGRYGSVQSRCVVDAASGIFPARDTLFANHLRLTAGRRRRQADRRQAGLRCRLTLGTSCISGCAVCRAALGLIDSGTNQAGAWLRRLQSSSRLN